MNKLDELLEQYFNLFKEYPYLPNGATYDMIQDLIEDSIISKKPITPKQVIEVIDDVDIPMDKIIK